jgi:hypothetical protein
METLLRVLFVGLVAVVSIPMAVLFVVTSVVCDIYYFIRHKDRSWELSVGTFRTFKTLCKKVNYVLKTGEMPE